MPTIIVNVEYKSKTIFGWEGLPVGENMNIKEFYENLVMPEIKRELWNKDIIAYFIRTNRKDRLTCNIMGNCWTIEVFVTFRLKDGVNLDEPAIQSINTFGLIMRIDCVNAKLFTWIQYIKEFYVLIYVNG